MNQEHHSKLHQIEIYLELNNDKHGHEILYKYSVLHEHFELIDIKIFYFLNLERIINICDEKIILCEIFVKLIKLLEKCDDSFYCCILINNFIAKNKLKHIYVHDSHSYHSILDQEIVCYTFKYPVTLREIQLINQGLISPLLFIVDASLVVLSKNTFGYLLNKKIEIEKLMNFDISILPFAQIIKLIDKTINDTSFKNSCRAFIKEKGIFSIISQLIASILQIKLKADNIDASNISRFYCKNHFKSIYIPFYQFDDLLNLTRHELYFYYLCHKDDINDDLNDIGVFFNDNGNSPDFHRDSSDFLNDFTSSQVIDNSKSQLDQNKRCHMSLNPVKSSLSFISSLESFIFKPSKRSIYAHVLDRLIRLKCNFPFDYHSLKYIRELECEPYHASFCYKYKSELICHKIYETIPDLNLNTTKKIKTTKIVDAKVQNDNAQLPTPQEFYENPQLRNEFLIEHTKKFDVDLIAKYFLLDTDYSNEVINFFKENCSHIKSNVAKALVMLKLGMDLDFHLKPTELLEIFEHTNTYYGMKFYIMHKKVCLKYINNYLVEIYNSTDKNMFECIDIGLNRPTRSFCIALIKFLEGKYDFRHYSNIMMKFLDYKDAKITLEIQTQIIKLLKSKFFDLSFLEKIEIIYRKLLEYSESQIRKNNDKILLLIVENCKLLGKQVVIGNIKG